MGKKSIDILRIRRMRHEIKEFPAKDKFLDYDWVLDDAKTPPPGKAAANINN